MTTYECAQASTNSDTDVSPESSEYGPVLLPKDQGGSIAHSTSELSNTQSTSEFSNAKTTGLGVRNVVGMIKFDDAATGTVGLELSITEIVSTQNKLIEVDSTDAEGRGFISSNNGNATQFTSTRDPALLISKCCESSDTVRWKFHASGDEKWIFGLVFEVEKLDNQILLREAQADVQSRIFLTGSMENGKFHDKWVSVTVDFRAGSMVLTCEDVTAERSFQVKDDKMRLALSTGQGTVIMIARTEDLENLSTNSPPKGLPSISDKVQGRNIYVTNFFQRARVFWMHACLSRFKPHRESYAISGRYARTSLYTSLP
jgi:hypothetical protein